MTTSAKGIWARTCQIWENPEQNAPFKHLGHNSESFRPVPSELGLGSSGRNRSLFFKNYFPQNFPPFTVGFLYGGFFPNFKGFASPNNRLDMVCSNNERKKKTEREEEGRAYLVCSSEQRRSMQSSSTHGIEAKSATGSRG